MDWYSDEALRQAFPGTSTLTPAQLAQLAQDATVVYDYVVGNPGLADTDLRLWGEGRGLKPDRLNVALHFLSETGKLYGLPDGTVLTSGEALAAQEQKASRIADAFTAEALKKAAGNLGLDVAKSAPKEQLASAVAAAL